MWYELAGTIKTRAGVSGTEAFASGTRVLKIMAIATGAGASVALPNGAAATATIPIPSGYWFNLDELHTARVMGTPQGGLTIVFAATASYFVEYLDPSGTT